MSDNFDQKLDKLQDKIVEAVLAKSEAQIASLKAEIEELKKKANRLEVSEQPEVNGLVAAAKAVAHSDLLTPALEARSRYTVNIKGNPYDLEKKSVVWDPGNQTINGDIRQVLAATQRQGIIPFRLRPLAIRDLLKVVPTTDKYINYVRETGNTNNADYVAMTNLKPESAMDFVVERAMIETIAHTLTCPLQLARDVNAFEAWLTNKMVTMLRLKSETAYLYGNGNSPQIRGITNFSGIQTLSQTSTTDNRIDTLRKALNALEISFYPWADNMILHPNDVMRMELLKDAEDRYLWPTFGTWATGVNANKSLFGVPIISTTAVTESTALVGNFAEGVTLYQREDVNVRVSFDTLDYFQRNLMMIRVESDECLVPEDAKCFVLTTFLGPTYD